MKQPLALFLLIITTQWCFSQKSEKAGRYFTDPIIVDSTSTIMIPTRYDADLFTSNKIVLWNDYYANILFYNFQTDSTKKLFAKDTFIKGFSNYYSSFYPNENNAKLLSQSSNWIFYFVKESDYNGSGRIDEDDPSILYISDKYGNNLKALTAPNENAESIKIFEKQGFALIKIQRDLNGDLKFETKDKDYYFIRFDLSKLTFGKKIEIK